MVRASLDRSGAIVVRCPLRWFVRIVARAPLDQSGMTVRAVLVPAPWRSRTFAVVMPCSCSRCGDLDRSLWAVLVLVPRWSNAWADTSGTVMSTTRAKSPEAAGSRFYHWIDPLYEPSEHAPDSLELSIAERLCVSKLSLPYPDVVSGLCP